MHRKKVVVVGAGAAGLIAAGKASEYGNEVILLEKNDRPGRKLLISGKGRCNITNDTDMEGIITNIPGNGSFLYSSLYTFSNYDIIDFFNKNGLRTKVERGGRIFPESDSASDVVEVLRRFALKNGTVLKLNSPAENLIIDKNKVKGIVVKGGGIIDCDTVILATGGVSYPGTGSTGDGIRMAEKAGHSIVPLKPSLVPLLAGEQWVTELQGLSLKNVEINIYNNNNKKIYNDFGEMLFTHFGVSGPLVLSASRHILEYGYRDVKLCIDLKPALDEATLCARIQRDFDKYSRKLYRNSLDELLPQKLIPVIISLSLIDADKPVNQITKEERLRLARLLKRIEISIVGARPISEAIVTAGGVCTDEINPSTMESKIIKGLYFAGEMIDVDGYTGGFNLTVAFSTGWLAGMLGNKE